jgi:hypothetical protein
MPPPRRGKEGSCPLNCMKGLSSDLRHPALSALAHLLPGPRPRELIIHAYSAPPPRALAQSLVRPAAMDASAVDWETVNANLPYDHSEEAHVQRRSVVWRRLASRGRSDASIIQGIQSSPEASVEISQSAPWRQVTLTGKPLTRVYLTTSRPILSAGPIKTSLQTCHK